VDIFKRFISPDRMILLAPSDEQARGTFRHVWQSRWLHEQLQSEMQRLRGGIYLQDGAISRAELSEDGRHILPYDAQSWHLLSMDNAGRVMGCTRYLLHECGSSYRDLRVSKSALARSAEWGCIFRAAVERELDSAWHSGFSYVEVGGWAMAEQVRGSGECVRSVLATYAWSRLIGGALGISTATERNGSACILGRLGGQPLEWGPETIPAYFDAQYGCNMHILRFDSRRPNPKYEQAIQQLQKCLTEVPVICGGVAKRKTASDGVAALPSFSFPAVARAY
jgi:hypothetical protein